MKFAHFEFEPQTDRLGEGPLSEVYRAVDLDLGRTVALKILRSHAEIDPAADQRFHREARNTSKLDHANIATVYEYGKDHGTSFIAMEYLDGQPLDRVLKEQTIGYEECQRIALQVCAALAHVHKSGLIHRDLKPGNIMVLNDGTVKLLDFGIARASNESSITQVGMLVGTVLYMAPEQVRGDELDYRSDVFALGSVLYQMMTGALPFPGKSFPEVCMAILDGSVVPPTRVRSGFPKPLEDFILKCMQSDPARRYPDAEEAYGALLSATEAIARRPATRTAKVEGAMLVAPFSAVGGLEEAAVMAAGVRKDLAGQLSRIQGLSVDLLDRADPPAGRPFDYVLRGRLDLEDGRGRLELQLERYDREGDRARLRGKRVDAVEQEEEDEWALQASLVRNAGRAVRRRLTELSIAPASEATRDAGAALELSNRAREKLLRGTTKHLMGAVSMFRRAMELDPYCADAYAGLAEALVRKYLYWDGDGGYLNEARDYCEQALALDPECARAHTALGFAFHLSGHQTDAQREYRIAIQLDEREWFAHRLLGAVLRRNGNFKEAEPRLQRAVELHPSHIGSYDHLYNVLKRLDRHDEARGVALEGIDAARACVDAEPDNQEARLGMAMLHARLGDAAEARRLVRHALELAAKDGYTSYLAGCVHSVLNEAGEAIALMRKAHDRGFYVQSELRNNDDLDALRDLPEFEDLVS